MLKKRTALVILIVVAVMLTSCNVQKKDYGNSSNNFQSVPIKVKNNITVDTISEVRKNNIQMEGAINNSLKVHMNIQINDGKVQGSYYYDNYKTDIQLKGDIEANRMITLKEYSKDGTVTGTFEGWYVPGIRIEGSWINEKTKVALIFELKILNGIDENAKWAGEWKRMNSGQFSTANLIAF